MNPDFWSGKRVLVVGHTGFKGSWLSLWLAAAGARVSGYSLGPPTNPSMYELLMISDRVHSVEADIRNLPALWSTTEQVQPEIIIHMAAQPLVRASYSEPVDTYSTNVMGTVNVLEVVRRLDSVKTALVVTSDKCYANREWVWPYREDEPLGGDDPYSSSKACAELITAAYRKSYFADARSDKAVALATARAGNVIGGGDWARDRLIPDIVRSFTDGRPVAIRYPEAIRPWQHVLEALDGYLTLIEHLWSDPARHSGAWNFGPTEKDMRPVAWIADYIAHNWGDGARWHGDCGRQPHEAGTLRVDSSKARSRLPWRPRLSLDTALAWTIEWYRAYQLREDVLRLTMDQIARYHEEPALWRN